MKIIKVLLGICAIIGFTSVSAQVSKDSLSTLNQEKKDISRDKQINEISKRLNDNKLKVAQLENTLDQKTKDLQSAQDKSQKSADNNGVQANKLTADPQNKTMSHDASNSAKFADRDAKSARKAGTDLETLKKEIQDLHGKIGEDEKKIIALQGHN